MKRLVIAVFCALLLTACGGSDNANSPEATTSTTEVVLPTAPLTGLAQPDEDKRTRPLLTVKIDNHPAARPQFGIDKADVIVEEKVEGGLSRFMALFQSQDAERVGPVRSLRSTDVNWLKPEGGMIAYSGGIAPVKNQLSRNGIADIGADTHGVKYYKRRNDRSFEHSMYVNTTVLRELTPKDAKTPPPLFDYLKRDEKFSGLGIAPAASVSLRMAGVSTAVTFDWTWDAGAGVYRRGTDGKAHQFEGAGQVGMKNVVVQFTPYRATPWVDTAGSPVDEAAVVGSGDAWILSDGQIIRGKWTRATDSAVTKYTDGAGAPIKLQPGQTWLSLVPPGEFTEVK